MPTTKRCKALIRAIRQAGGPAKLAVHIHRVSKKPITTQAISQWLVCPPRRVRQVTSAPGVAVTAAQLCPDVYATK